MIRRHPHHLQCRHRSFWSIREWRRVEWLPLTGGLITLLGLVSLCAMTAPASAQVVGEGLRSRTELPLADSSGALSAQGFGAGTIHEEHPETFSFWEHGAGQCCGNCLPGWRVRADGLLFNYIGRSEVRSSNAFSQGDFSYETGGRVSVVRHLDCLDAWEAAYIGPFEWTELSQLNGVGLNSRLNSVGVNLSEFNNATFHGEFYRTRLNSFELNRRWYGWDVISTLAGVRYMNVGEDYLFASTGAGGAGLLSVETNNHMAGPQVGLEMKYPLGNWMTTSTLKGAAMFNSADTDFRVVNAGVVEVANEDRNLFFASVIEIGYFFSYQITPRVKVHGGYEFWWMYGVAVIPGQLNTILTPDTGSRVDGNEQVYYHGATVGIEVVW